MSVYPSGSPAAEELAPVTFIGFKGQQRLPASLPWGQSNGGTRRSPQCDPPTHASSLLSTSRSCVMRTSLGSAWLCSTAFRKSLFPKHSFLQGVSNSALLSP